MLREISKKVFQAKLAEVNGHTSMSVGKTPSEATLSPKLRISDQNTPQLIFEYNMAISVVRTAKKIQLFWPHCFSKRWKPSQSAQSLVSTNSSSN